MRFYSPSTGGFYTEAVHGALLVAQPQSKAEIKAGKRPEMADNPDCRIPGDAVQVSEARFAELMAAQAEGKEIVAIGGKPVARERAVDPDALAAARRRERDRRLAASDWTQLADATPAGGREAWADYRQALRDLDMAGTDWPATPGGED